MKRLVFILLTLQTFLSFSQTPSQIVKKAYYKLQGNTQYATMHMRLIRPNWIRAIDFKYAAKGTDYALIVITGPEREKGQAFLLVKNKIWMYSPKINSVIKLGASMISQNWMGSDFSNDELIYQGSIVKDYYYQIKGTDTLDNRKCWIIQLDPKPGAQVAWGKVLMWIDQKDYLILKTQFFDEDGYLTKTEIATDIKKMNGRIIPTKYIVFTADAPGNKTELTIKDIKFNVNIPQNFFTVDNLKKGANIKFNF